MDIWICDLTPFGHPFHPAIMVALLLAFNFLVLPILRTFFSFGPPCELVSWQQDELLVSLDTRIVFGGMRDVMRCPPLPPIPAHFHRNDSFIGTCQKNLVLLIGERKNLESSFGF